MRGFFNSPLRGLFKKSHRGSALNFTPSLRGLFKKSSSAGRFLPHRSEPTTAVIPAHAGIQGLCLFVFALRLFPHEQSEHERPKHLDPDRLWIPAFAGMTNPNRFPPFSIGLDSQGLLQKPLASRSGSHRRGRISCGPALSPSQYGSHDMSDIYVRPTNKLSLSSFFNSPLSGGYKKAMRPRRAEVALLFLAPCRGLSFLTPLSRGGRGGWFYPLRGC